MSKFQEAGSILRVGFALSKGPHFDSVYLLRGRFVLLSIVFVVVYTPKNVKVVVKSDSHESIGFTKYTKMLINKMQIMLKSQRAPSWPTPFLFVHEF